MIIGLAELEPYWFFYFSAPLEIANRMIEKGISGVISNFYSLYKILTTKSLLINNSKIFVFLEITLILPWNMCIILIGSLLNISIIQLFGLPIYIPSNFI